VLSSQACGFVLLLANFLPIHKHHHSTNREQRIASHRIAVLSSHACGFVLLLVNFYKYKSLIAQPMFSSQACGLVLRLPNFHNYKSIITRLTDSNALHRSVVISSVWFCITACKLFTNTKASSLNQCFHLKRVDWYYCLQTFYNYKSIITQPTETQACGFVLHLANFLQIQKHHRSTNPEQRIASQCFHLKRVVL
jgi:hypothetical protein